MRRLPIVLLPGMDGTGDLFTALVKTTPPEFEPIVISLPPNGSYDQLSAVISGQLPRSGRFAVLGESFSGPLALRAARGVSDRLVGVILCNSFIVPPRGRLWRSLPWSFIFSLPLPSAAIRIFFVGREASSEVIAAVRAALIKTPRRILVDRIRSIHNLNDAELLRNLSVPILHLLGTKDVLVPRSANAIIQQIAPHVKVENIQGPHLLLQMKPVEAWIAIRRFCEGGLTPR